MTREEAIKWVKLMHDLYPSDTVATEALDMAIEALHQKGAYEQTKWERDMALQTLEEHGIGLGQKHEPSIDAEEEVLHKILEKGMIELPQEYVSVVRCKDCDRKLGSTVCPCCTKEYHINEETFYCAWGERREE